MAAVAIATPALAQKVAYVASEEILGRLPEVREARAKLAEAQAGWMREIQKQESDITQLKGQMEANRLLWSPQERRDAETRLRELEARLATFRSAKYETDGEYDKLHQELMQPLYKKVFDAINEEAKAQKYDFVFDKSSRGMPMLFANPDYDLTASVLTRLGIKVDPADSQQTVTDTSSAPQMGGSPRRGRRDAEPPNGSNPAPSTDPNDVLNGATPPKETGTK